jgi:DNA polymerase I-like protein with 3'-5' exonuclease and polymerase domains
VNIRSAFVPKSRPDGERVLVCADYMQCELRVRTHSAAASQLHTSLRESKAA